MNYEIVVPPHPDDADHAAIDDRLAAYNDLRASRPKSENIAVLIRSPKNETVGGLWGVLSWYWLFVELLFVPDELRGRGIGTELIQRAERIARDRNCVGVWLDTHGFQAPGFYERLGYGLFGELPDHPPGWKRMFYRKLL